MCLPISAHEALKPQEGQKMPIIPCKTIVCSQWIHRPCCIVQNLDSQGLQNIAQVVSRQLGLEMASGSQHLCLCVHRGLHLARELRCSGAWFAGTVCTANRSRHRGDPASSPTASYRLSALPRTRRGRPRTPRRRKKTGEAHGVAGAAPTWRQEARRWPRWWRRLWELWLLCFAAVWLMAVRHKPSG